MNEPLQNTLRGLKLLQPSSTPDVGLPPVVSVLDDFSEQCFNSTAGLWPVLPGSHPVDLDCIAPDFLMVESAWNGNNGAWRYLVTSSGGPRPPLLSLVDQARKRGIPTVFWNKEDPPHFDDFSPAAKLFDYIFTTEASLIQQYQQLAPHAQVGVLKFAASTALHRPAQVEGGRGGDVCFAGQYFRDKYPERREQMDFLFHAAAQFDFTIYSRMLGGEEKYAFPQEFQRFIAGSMPYEEMVKEYRRHKVFLNVNSVPSSESMCARRVFELASSKTIVLSAASPAIRSVYGDDEVPMAVNSEEAFDVLQTVLSDETARKSMAHLAWRRTAREHTYAHRMRHIRDVLGLSTNQCAETVGLVTPSGLPHEALDRLAGSLLAQRPLQGFTWVWQLDEPSWLAGRESIVQQLTAVGIEVTSDCTPTWWAAWHPGAVCGEYYLQDMLLYASRYTDELAASATPRETDSELEDSVIPRVWSAGWLAHRESIVSGHLLAAARQIRAHYVETAGTYLVSGVSIAEAHQRGGVPT
ncbi:MAG: CgeB family protein [Arachnia sp.]